MFGGTDKIIAYLCSHCLLSASKSCSRYLNTNTINLKNVYCRCSFAMEERERSDISDGVSWYCPQCYTRNTIKDGSFFSKSHLTLQKWLLLMYLWARPYTVTDAMEEADVDRRTAIDIYQRLREVYSTKLLSSPIVLGGPGVVVQIDESLFRHKPKVNKNISVTIIKSKFFYQLKHHHGRPTTEQIWIFGLVDTSQTPL